VEPADQLRYSNRLLHPEDDASTVEGMKRKKKKRWKWFRKEGAGYEQGHTREPSAEKSEGVTKNAKVTNPAGIRTNHITQTEHFNAQCLCRTNSAENGIVFQQSKDCVLAFSVFCRQAERKDTKLRHRTSHLLCPNAGRRRKDARFVRLLPSHRSKGNVYV